MTLDYFIKSMLAGMGFPGIALPVIYTALYLYNPALIQSNPLQFIPMYIPILFGITNIIYLKMGHRFFIQDINLRLWATGACLGLIVAIFGVFILKLPALVFGLSHGFQYLPLILLPVIYGALFRYIVKALNQILGV